MLRHYLTLFYQQWRQWGEMSIHGQMISLQPCQSSLVYGGTHELDLCVLRAPICEMGTNRLLLPSGTHMDVYSFLRAHWPHLFPRFLSYSCRNSKLLAYHLKDLASTCLGDLKFYSSRPNEQGNEKAFQESVKENPFILSSGNNWATILIRERSDFQATQWPASSSTTPTTQGCTPRVFEGSRMLRIQVYPISSSTCGGYNIQPPNTTSPLLIEHSRVGTAWSRDGLP